MSFYYCGVLEFRKINIFNNIEWFTLYNNPIGRKKHIRVYVHIIIKNRRKSPDPINGCTRTYRVLQPVDTRGRSPNV